MTIAAQDLRDAVAEGMHPTALAGRLGTTRATVYRAERKFGVVLNRGKPGKPQFDARKAVQDMRPMDAVEYLLDLIDAIGIGEPAATWEWPGVHLTVQEKLILRKLGSRPLRAMSRDHLMAALEAVGSQAECGNFISVRVSQLRKYLAHEPIRFVSVHGVGYRIEAPSGYVFPWEAAAEAQP